MKKIMLFGGHAPGKNYNRGFKTVNKRKNNEGDNNIRMERLIKNYLIDNYEGAKIVAYMSDNNIKKDISASKRASLAKGYDVYVSIHSNAGGGTGVETYISYKQNSSSIKLADDINKSLAKQMGIPNRGIRMMTSGRKIENYPQPKGKFDYLGEIRNNPAKTVVLVEMFFHDNISDVKAFYKNERKVIEKIGDAIAKSAGLKKKEHKTFYAKVISKRLNIRKGPGMKYDVVGKLYKGDVYTIIDTSGNWGKLKYNLGWIHLGHQYVEKYTTLKQIKKMKKGDIVYLDNKKYRALDEARLEVL